VPAILARLVPIADVSNQPGGTLADIMPRQALRGTPIRPPEIQLAKGFALDIPCWWAKREQNSRFAHHNGLEVHGGLLVQNTLLRLEALIRLHLPARINIHTIPGVLHTVNMPTRPTTPPMRNSHPATISTANVAIIGRATATSPSTSMISPWIRNSIQWERTSSRIARWASSRLGFAVDIAFLLLAPWSEATTT
jgi:hypothetical protein